MDVRGKKVKLSIWVSSSHPSHQSKLLINFGPRIPLAKNDFVPSLPPTTEAPKV